MADRRCFTKKITESDAFLEMPLTTQCLYFHLNMSADDDGFVNAPKKIARMVGASDDDIKILIAKSFLICFETGVIVIKHWRMHNTLKNDRYHPTSYQEEYQLLGLKDNKAYTMDTNWIQNGYKVEPELNITKHNLTKHKNKYGAYENVLLTEDERKKLEDEYGNIYAEELITYLDEYIEMKGYKAKSHYLAIKKWVDNAIQEKRQKVSRIEKNAYVDIVPDYTNNNQEVDLEALKKFRSDL